MTIYFQVSREILIQIGGLRMANESVVGGAGQSTEKKESVVGKVGNFLKPYVPGVGTTQQKIGAVAIGVGLLGLGIGIDRIAVSAKSKTVQPSTNAKSV